MKNSMSCGIRNGEVVSARGATACFVKGIYVFIVDVVIKFRVLRQCVVFSSRSNIGKDECGAVMDILLTHTLKLRIMNAMPVGQAPWASCQWFMHRH